MAIDTPARHIYTGNGNQRVFPIPTKIIGDDYIRIEIDSVYQSDRTKWDIVNNSVIFITAPLNGVTIDIQVATSEEALSVLGSSTAMDIVAESITNVNITATNIVDINTVSHNITEVDTVANNISSVVITANDSDEINILASIHTQLESLYADMAKITSLYNDKITLDSLYSDKTKLDAIFSDLNTIEGLFSIKSKLESLYADKTKLDSLYADKYTLDTLYSMKEKLDSLYADKNILDSLYADKTELDSIYANLNSIISIYENIDDVNYFADRYLGSKSSNPTVRNDGTTLQVGDLYFNSTTKLMNVFDGATWSFTYVSLEKLALTVDTIDDLKSGATTGDTCIVRDLYRGGIFIYDSTKISEHNDGTNFNGWVRQYSGAVNVRWFGAKGDGITDDTAAIQNSFNSLKSKSYAGTLVYRGVRESIIFDYGKYLISAEITVPSSYITILGEGAILTAMTNDFICFKIPSNAWHFKLIGLKFEYFKTAFYANSSNLDTGTNIIDSCVFLNCYDMALYIDAQSSITNINNCRFVGNKKVMHIEKGDVVTFKDSWVTSGTGEWSLTDDYDGQIVIKAGQFYAKNILTVPLPQTAGALEVCWFKNYANLYIDNVRFGGETGSFSPVNNFKGLGSTNTPSKLTIKNSNCYSVVPNLGAPAIRLFDVPNILTLEDNIGFAETKMIQFSSSVTSPGELISSNRYIISIKKNGFPTYLSSLPKELLPFLNDVSGAYRPNDSIGESIWKKGVSIGNNVIITLNHIDDRDRTSIGKFPIVNLEYTSNKNPAGHSYYRGMLHGKISTVIRFQSVVSYVLEFHPIINRASTDTVPVDYTVTLAWAETGTRFLPITSTNFEYTVTIDKSSLEHSYRVYQDGAIPKTASNINLI